MRNLLLFMLLVGIFVIWRGQRGCGFVIGPGLNASGSVRTEQRNVSNFHQLDIAISADVEVVVADQYAVEVTASENILPVLKTEVENGKLKIYFDANINNTGNLRIKVSGPSFDAFDIAGSGNVRVTSPLRAEKLDLEVVGSGNLYLPQAELGTVNCDVAGSGSVQLGGTARQMHVEVVGSGNLDAQSMTIARLDAEIAGSGSVTANVTEQLDADVTGSGDVRYSGNPTVKVHTSGSGTVSRM